MQSAHSGQADAIIEGLGIGGCTVVNGKGLEHRRSLIVIFEAQVRCTAQDSGATATANRGGTFEHVHRALIHVLRAREGIRTAEDVRAATGRVWRAACLL